MKWGYRKVTGSPQCHSRDVARGAIAAAGREDHPLSYARQKQQEGVTPVTAVTRVLCVGCNGDAQATRRVTLKEQHTVLLVFLLFAQDCFRAPVKGEWRGWF